MTSHRFEADPQGHACAVVTDEPCGLTTAQHACRRTATFLTQDVPEVVNLRRYLTVGAVFFGFLFGIVADYMMFDAERAKILDQLRHDRAVVQQYRIALEKTR